MDIGPRFIELGFIEPRFNRRSLAKAVGFLQTQWKTVPVLAREALESSGDPRLHHRPGQSRDLEFHRVHMMAKAVLAPLPLLAAIVRTAPDALVVVNAHGEIMFANERTEQLFGCTREELMGQSMEGLLPGNGALECDDPRSLKATLRYVTAKDGQLVPVEIRSSSVPYEGATLVALSIRDVREREQLEHEAGRLREQLAHVGRVSALGELVSSVAHELNQPLAAILSGAQAAQRLLAREDPDVGHARLALDRIVAQERRASKVISNLRSLVRRELRESERLDIGALLVELDPLLSKSAIERQVSLQTKIAADLPQIEGNRVLLQQVFLNLVLNAFNAVERGEHDARSVTIEVHESSKKMVEVEVRDTGVGLEEAHLTKIFDPFVTSKRLGLGMGLSISRSVVEAHGGRIWAVNNASGGATFHVLLPSVD